MNVLMLYFSGTGNTRIVAEVIGENLLRRGHKARLLSIEGDVSLSNIDDYDAVGFLFPVYAWRPPTFFTDYLSLNLPHVDHKPAFIVNTKAIADWNANGYVENILDEKGFITFLSESIKAPPNDWMVLFRETHPLVKRYVKWGDNAWDNLERIADSIENNHKMYKPQKARSFVGSIASGLFSKPGMWLLGLAAKAFSVDKGLCTSCGLCIKECPAKNITANESGDPVFGNHCIVCFRCINRCPEKAILLTSLSRGKYRYRLRISDNLADDMG